MDSKKLVRRLNKILNIALIIVIVLAAVGWYFTPQQSEIEQKAAKEFLAAQKMLLP
jgi:uncharacterized protein HemX